MTINELKTNMEQFNKVEPRFYFSGDKLKLGTFPITFKFDEEHLFDIMEVINEYEMFKPLGESFGDSLYYKGYKWNQLTNEQKDSVINLFCSHKEFIKNPAKFEELFNDNKCFLVF